MKLLLYTLAWFIVQERVNAENFITLLDESLISRSSKISPKSGVLIEGPKQQKVFISDIEKYADSYVNKQKNIDTSLIVPLLRNKKEYVRVAAFLILKNLAHKKGKNIEYFPRLKPEIKENQKFYNLIDTYFK